MCDWPLIRGGNFPNIGEGDPGTWYIENVELIFKTEITFVCDMNI